MIRIRWSITGVLLGVAVVAVLLAMSTRETDGEPARPRPLQLTEDCEGKIQELVVHFTIEATDTVMPIYREFFRQLPSDVTVHVVCPDMQDFDYLQQRLGTVSCRLSPVIVGHPITCWSRDRWLALRSRDGTQAITLLGPHGEMGANVWPARAGDQRVAEELAATLDSVEAIRSRLYFDGGDFVTDSEMSFATPSVARRNLGHTATSPDGLRAHLESQLGRPVVLLEDAPDHHAGMFMMPVGNRTMLVGDPARGKRLWDEMDDAARDKVGLPGRPDFSESTIGQFEAVARRCQAAGYHVVRIPTVPSDDGRTYLTYLNAILDHRDGRRTVYLPVYSGADPLNEQAERIWSDLGYEVRPIDCTSCYRHFGTLRCLVNVLNRR
jgi:hypothetical protein